MGSERPSSTPRDAAVWRACIAVALLLASVTLIPAASSPFERGWLGHNGARYALIARNHERFGLTHLRGAPLIEPVSTSLTPDRPDVYAHHPPALGWTLALVFRAMGVSEAAAGAVPVVATWGLLLLFAWLVRAVAGPRAGGFAVLAAAAQPMLSVYGAHVDVQATPVLLLSLATLAGYLNWLRGGRIAWMLAAAALASAFDWYGLYMPVACAAHQWCLRRRGAAVGLVLWSLALFALWLAWLASLPSVQLGDVLGSASVRGPAALAGADGRLAMQVRAWFLETNALMPGWPALLALAAWVAWSAHPLTVRAGAGAASAGARSAGARAPGARAADAPATLSPRWMILLLLAPPLVHGLLFPAGMLLHGYWLFGLPLPLAAATGMLLAGWRPATAWAVVAGLLILGVEQGHRILERKDPLSRLVGHELAARTAPGDAILTNYETNPFVPGAPGDQYVLMRPEVAFYSDRVVRGGVGSPDSLAEALVRRHDARWFLLVPWPREAEAPLKAALRGASEGEPLELPSEPPAYLYRLKR